MGKSAYSIIANTLTNTCNVFRCVYAFFMLLIAALVNANEPYPIEWSSISVEAQDERLGDIKLEAKETKRHGFELFVVSELMKGQIPLELTRDIHDPNIRSLSIQVTDLYDGDVSEFSVCIWYGEAARINVGSEESPKYAWQQGQVTYTISGSGVSRKIYRNTDVLKISSCNLN